MYTLMCIYTVHYIYTHMYSIYKLRYQNFKKKQENNFVQEGF